MRKTGFSLVELMVTLAIISILATVAIPWYGQYVQRGNRGDGMSELQAILDAQERFYTDRMTYTTNLTQLGLANPHITGRGLYSITARTCTRNNITLPLTQCIELLATAQNSQVADGNLVINNLGRQDRLVNGAVADW